MPPRHAYWTIIIDDKPTSFRAHDVEELLPTFNRLREKNPTTQLKWFERGQLFDTRDAAREQGYGQGERRWEGPRPDRDKQDRDGETAGFSRGARDRGGPPRDKNWRPGGEHRDPRQKYKDAKKAKWDRFKEKISSRWEEKQQRRRGDEDLPPLAAPKREPFGREGGPVPDRGDHTPPHGDPIRPKLGPPALSERQRVEGPAPSERKRVEGRKNLGAPAGMKPEWRDRPPRASERESRGPRDDRRRDDRPRDDRRPPRASEGGWREDRPRGDYRESRRDDRPRDDRGRDGWKRDDWRRDLSRAQSRDSSRAQSREDRPREFRRDDDRRGGWKPKGPPRDRDRGEWKPKGPPRPPRASERESRGDRDRKPWGGKSGGKPGGKAGGARKPWGSKPGGGRKPYGSKPAGTGVRKKPFGSGPPRPRGPKKRRDDDE